MTFLKTITWVIVLLTGIYILSSCGNKPVSTHIIGSILDTTEGKQEMLSANVSIRASTYCYP